MKQLVQLLRNGKMSVEDLPQPILTKGFVLVQNHYSLISAGTEGSTVRVAKKSLLGKIQDRPAQAKAVLDLAISQGVTQAYRAVSKKLDSFSPLGYSSAGVVIGVGEGVSEFEVGDLVGCAGAGYANHAEIVSVPKNLCVKLLPKADLKDAAYNTLGAIAMQSVRVSDLRVGESCAVIGMGLLGQLTGLILKASGVKVIGVDINPATIDKVHGYSCDLALLRSDSSIESKIEAFTGRLGCDSVIIAAAGNDNDPINFAGAICRKKGKVVILGDVPTGFDRNPHWYKKELQLLMSCSYGPGRYDPIYEENGIDYPAAYVRWSEKRNMEAFQELISSKKIEISPLTSHIFKLENAVSAYDMILKGSESYSGILIEYNTSITHKNSKTPLTVNPKAFSAQNRTLGVSFIGAGSYAQGNILPNIDFKKKGGVKAVGILAANGTTSKRVGSRYGFDYATSNVDDILKDQSGDVIFIATRHDSHAEYTVKAIQNNKACFVEKPLALNMSELNAITEAYQKTDSSNLMVGYNRRFSSLSIEAKKFINSSSIVPLSMIYRVNAQNIDPDHWIQDFEKGGGRIIGEVCHFIDLLTFFCDSMPKSVFASRVDNPAHTNDTLNIVVEFENGSSGVIAYYSNGPKSMPKEYIEIYAGAKSAVIYNFKELKLFGKSSKRVKLLSIDKGQKRMIKEFLNSIYLGKILIPFNELSKVSKATFSVLESLRSKSPSNVN